MLLQLFCVCTRPEIRREFVMPQSILHICELFMFTVLKEALVSVLIFSKRKMKPSDLKHWHLVLSIEQSWSLLFSSIVVHDPSVLFPFRIFDTLFFQDPLIFKWNKYNVRLFLRNLYTWWSKSYLQLKCEMPPCFEVFSNLPNRNFCLHHGVCLWRHLLW